MTQKVCDDSEAGLLTIESELVKTLKAKSNDLRHRDTRDLVDTVSYTLNRARTVYEATPLGLQSLLFVIMCCSARMRSEDLTDPDF